MAESTFPHEDGDSIVLGPEIFVAADGSVICWKGENYTRQEIDPVRAIAEHRTAIHNAGPVRVDSRDAAIADAKQRADELLWSVLP